MGGKDLGREQLTQAPILFTHPRGDTCVSSRPLGRAETISPHSTHPPASPRGQGSTGKGEGISIRAGYLDHQHDAFPGPSSGPELKRPPRSHPCLARAVAAALLPGAPTSSHLPLSHITAIRHPVRRIQFPPTFLNVSQSVSLSTPTSAPHLVTFNTSYHVNTIPVCPPQLLPPCYSISDSLMMIMMVVAIIIMITAPVYRVLSMCPELDQGP